MQGCRWYGRKKGEKGRRTEHVEAIFLDAAFFLVNQTVMDNSRALIVLDIR